MRALPFVVALAACHPTVTPPTGTVTEYRDGRWFDGTAFVARTMWVVGDRFAGAKPARVDATVDLHGGFVVPPYGDAHNHWLEPALVDAYVATYLRDGVFYVKDQSTPPAFHAAIAGAVNRFDTVDYIATHQGFTGPGGHPSEIVVGLASLGLIPKEWAATAGEGDALFVVASESDVDRAWSKLVATKPAFVKVFLVHSDEYAARRDNAELSPKSRGIDPALVPGIVKRAHAANLRVSAHIENAADFHVAVAAGADDIAHLPFVEAGDLASYRLTDADILALAGRRGSIATTTDWASDATTPDDPRVAVERDNITRLLVGGVTVVIGTDLFRQTARVEVERLAKLKLLAPLALLRAWSIKTPRAIFPDRRVGELTHGAEASFLVLGGDPLADSANLHAIVSRVKQGRALLPRDLKLPSLE